MWFDQEWFYVEDYSILNFMFYFFLNLGSALWAVGIRVRQSLWASCMALYGPDIA